MTANKGKKTVKALHTKIFEKNIDIFSGHEYMYTGSVILFRELPKREKIPDDIDAAINRDNKSIQDIEILCQKIIKTPETSELKMRTVFARTYTIQNISHRIEKNQNIDTRTIDPIILQALLDTGNIRISYKIYGMTIELFPEKNGTGLRNLGNMSEIICRQKIKTDHQTEMIIPFQNHLTTAQGYAMNFLKEIVRNNIYRFMDPESKPKDGIRLFTIISLLEQKGEDASPAGVLKFIQNTVKRYTQIPQDKRSLYVDSAIQEFPRIQSMLKKIIKEFESLIKPKHVTKHKFTSFYQKLGSYKKELNTYSEYLQKDMLSLLKKDILGEKYIITDAVTSFSHNTVKCDQQEVKKISYNIEKIIQSIEHFGFKNRNESFAYFYEMYMFKNLFITPIKKIL